MPAYCVAANCNNSQWTKNVTMRSFPRNKQAVRRKWVKFWKWVKFVQDWHCVSAHTFVYWPFCWVDLRQLHVILTGFTSKRHWEPAAVPSVHKGPTKLKQPAERATVTTTVTTTATTNSGPVAAEIAVERRMRHLTKRNLSKVCIVNSFSYFLLK